MNPCESCGVNDRMTGWKHCDECARDIELTGGQWVPDRMGILRWKPDEPLKPKVAPVPIAEDYRFASECPVCKSGPGTRCVSGGKTYQPHRARYMTCECGGPLTGRGKFCIGCHLNPRSIKRAA